MRCTNCKICCIFVDFHQNNDFSLGICWDGKNLYFQSDFGQYIILDSGRHTRGEVFNTETELQLVLKASRARQICPLDFGQEIEILRGKNENLASMWILGLNESLSQGLFGAKGRKGRSAVVHLYRKNHKSILL